MNLNDPPVGDYLLQVYNQTQGDMERQTSMHDVGAALGMDKGEAADLGQELIVEGLLDLRTLAGGVSLTAQGFKVLEKAGLVAAALRKTFTLGRGPFLAEGERESLEKIIAGIKKELSSVTAAYDDLEQTIIDIKTFEVQMLSSRPRTAILRAILQSLSESLSKTGRREMAALLGEVVA